MFLYPWKKQPMSKFYIKTKGVVETPSTGTLFIQSPSKITLLPLSNNLNGDDALRPRNLSTYHLSGLTMPVVIGDAHIGNGSSAVTLIGIMVSRASDIQLQHCMCDLKAIKSRFSSPSHHPKPPRNDSSGAK